MNAVLWTIAIVLALVFGLAGLMKATQPKEKLAANMGWVDDFSANTVKLIGIAEILGALGLILPAVTGIATWLTPLAAAGLAVTMLGAIVVHVRRKEIPLAAFNVVLLALAAFLAWQRFGPNAF